MHAWTRQGFPFSHKQSMQEDFEFLEILSIWIRQNERLLEAFADIRPNLMFLMIQILNPYPAEF